MCRVGVSASDSMTDRSPRLARSEPLHPESWTLTTSTENRISSLLCIASIVLDCYPFFSYDTDILLIHYTLYSLELDVGYACSDREYSVFHYFTV